MGFWIKEKNFAKLFSAVFISELGGYLTNVVILFYINARTDGDLFYLGLSQALFVGPMAIGTLIGGSVGESFDRRKIMLFCEFMNLALITCMFFVNQVLIIIVIRAFIVFFAGMYNPSRQSIVQEIVSPEQLKNINAVFTAMTGALHCLAPLLGALAFRYFGGVKEIFALNIATYLFGILMIFKLKHPVEDLKTWSYRQIFKDIKEGFNYIQGRADLKVLMQNFSLAGVLVGVFFPTLLPFISETFKGNENTYGQLMIAFGGGGMLGAILTPSILKKYSKGKVLVVAGLGTVLLLLVWTQMKSLELSYFLISMWGLGLMILMTTYVTYIQHNVARPFRTRAFSLYDQSISLSVVAGAVLVSLVGRNLSAYELLTLTSSIALVWLLMRLFTGRITSLYRMET